MEIPLRISWFTEERERSGTDKRNRKRVLIILLGRRGRKTGWQRISKKRRENMKKFKKLRTFMASFLVLTMVAGLVPEYALAVSGNQVAADQTYSGSGRVESDDEWDSYTVQINLTVKEGKISGLTVANEDEISDTGNLSYMNRALNGTKKATGIAEQVTGLEASMDALDAAQIDAVSGATCSSEGLKAAIKDALKQAPEAEKSTEETSKEETTAAPETKETEASTEAPTKETEASTEAPTKETEKETEEEKPAVVYAVMNVPYADFYEAEIKNDTSVDAVSSATTTKSVKFANTYFTQSEAGVTIKGIKMPVSMSEETYESIKNLVTEEDADYYISETQKTEPAAYKELTYTDGTYHFSATKGAYSTSSDANAKLTEDSTWGDFQLAMSDSLDAADVYGVYVTTTDGTSYGMRHEENIWAPSSYHELAWSTGIKTKEPHGNTLNGAHYASMMGKTLESVTWICTDGVHKVTLGTSQYVAVKLATTVTVEDAKTPSGTTAVTFSEALPEDYAAEYSVEGLEMSVKDGVMTYEKAKAGTYTLMVTDANGKYAGLSANFTLSTEEMPATFDSAKKALVPAEGYTAEDLASYLSNITSVIVGDTEYAATGRRSVKIVNEDGSINLEAASGDTAIFESCKQYAMVVKAAGYPELSFTLDTHSYDEGTVTREATCTEDGTMTYTCTICGATYEEVIAATGHDYEAVVTEPTATEKGYTTYTCKHCGDRYVSDYTDPIGEDPTEPVDPEDPAEPVNPSNPARPTNPADSGKPADSKKSTAGKVHTGDSNTAALWLALLAMSGAAGVVATRKKRRDEI